MQVGNAADAMPWRLVGRSSVATHGVIELSRETVGAKQAPAKRPCFMRSDNDADDSQDRSDNGEPDPGF